MALESAALILTPFWQKERLLLVRAADAIRLCRDGAYEEVPRHLAEACLAKEPGRDLAKLRDFVLRARLASAALPPLDERRLDELVRKSVRSADLVVVRECAVAAKEDSQTLARQRRLVRAIEAPGREALRHEGRKYRLVADADLGRLSNRDSFEVVRRNDAIVVLEALAKQAEPSLAALLGEARGLLTQDWRPPLSADGLVLLKAIVVRSADRPELPMGKPRPAAAPSEPAGARPEPETIRANVDQERQAAAHLAAAPDGVPFYEICVRQGPRVAKAVPPSPVDVGPAELEGDRSADQARQAETQIEASRKAMPFCEKCAQAGRPSSG